MKRIELPSNPGVLSLCFTPAEIALACRLKKAVVLAEIKAGRLGPSLKPCETQVLVPGAAVNEWLWRARLFDGAFARPVFLELHYTPAQIGLLCGANKEAVLAEMKAGGIFPAYKPFENRVIAPASAVQRWLSGASISPAPPTS